MLAKKTFPRDGYKVFMEMVVVSLGGKVDGFTFKLLGPDHHSCWMAKMRKRDRFTTPLASSAARHDLDFMSGIHEESEPLSLCPLQCCVSPTATAGQLVLGHYLAGGRGGGYVM